MLGTGDSTAQNEQQQSEDVADHSQEACATSARCFDEHSRDPLGRSARTVICPLLTRSLNRRGAVATSFESVACRQSGHVAAKPQHALLGFCSEEVRLPFTQKAHRPYDKPQKERVCFGLC